MNKIKDGYNKTYVIKFDKRPKKIQELKDKIKPLEKTYIEELGATIWFGKNEDGACASTMQMEFKPKEKENIPEYWTYNDEDFTFVKVSAMADNIFTKNERPVSVLIEKYFSN